MVTDTPSREPPENALPEQPEQSDGTQRTETDGLVPDYENADADAIYARIRAETPDLRIGQVLRAVREAQGLELDLIARELRHNRLYLMAIERMETSTLPSASYLTPILRSYAGRLGLDTDRVVEDYTEDCGGVARVSAPQAIIAPDSSEKPAWRRPAAIGTAIAAACGLAVGLGLIMTDGEGSEGPQMVGEPVNGARESLFANSPLPDRAEVERLPLTLVALRDGWVEVRGADGTIFRSRVMRAGEAYAPRAGAGWTISARDGSAFEWRLGDAVIGPLGPEAAPVYAASVDAAASRAMEVAAPALASAGNGQPSR